MSNKENGGPAFPFAVECADGVGNFTAIHEGMTLRDYFAAKAMQAILINQSMSKVEIAKASYAVADAMLKERDK